MSFFIDPFLLVFFGILIAVIGKKKYKEDSFLIPVLSIFCLFVFYTLSVSLFCNLNGAEHGLFGVINEVSFEILKIIWVGFYEAHPEAAASSTEFMFSSGIEAFKPPFNDLSGLMEYPLYLFAGIWMFLLYPVWLYLGIKTGIFLFGKQPGDKGFRGML